MNEILCGFLNVFRPLLAVTEDILGVECRAEDPAGILPFALLFIVIAALFS